MKIRIFVILAILLSSLAGISCTTFVIKTANELVFGRNLDWVSDNGLIVVNQRNIHKKSLVFFDNEPIEWTSKYGNITFNQFGKEFPFGGMNEKGLVIEIMLAKADYPASDSRKVINEVQWIQYHLDNSASIDEVISSDSILRISPIAQQLHYLVCDSSGELAVIEFKNGKIQVYRGDNLPIPVLENDVYSVSMDNYKAGLKCRFGTAANLIKQYGLTDNISAVDYSFKILDSVALSAEWSIVYDIKNMQIHFTTTTNRRVQFFDFNDFSFDCSKNTKALNLQSLNNGNVSNLFFDFTHRVNKKKMKDGIKTNELAIPRIIRRKFYNYHKSCTCN